MFDFEYDLLTRGFFTKNFVDRASKYHTWGEWYHSEEYAEQKRLYEEEQARALEEAKEEEKKRQQLIIAELVQKYIDIELGIQSDDVTFIANDLKHRIHEAYKDKESLGFLEDWMKDEEETYEGDDEFFF